LSLLANPPAPGLDLLNLSRALRILREKKEKKTEDQPEELGDQKWDNVLPVQVGKDLAEGGKELVLISIGALAIAVLVRVFEALIMELVTVSEVRLGVGEEDMRTELDKVQLTDLPT